MKDGPSMEDPFWEPHFKRDRRILRNIILVLSAAIFTITAAIVLLNL